MKAVHFGAGNIGRGFVGLLLHEGGYDLVFSDVAAPLVDAINEVDEYTVHEVGEGPHTFKLTASDGLNPPTVVTRGFTADRTPPDTALADGPAAGSSDPNTRVAASSRGPPGPHTSAR